MADKQQAARPLTYSLHGIETVKAECERFVRVADASSGVFRQSLNLQVDQRADTKNDLELSYELTVTGEAKDADKGDLAFIARCKLSCIATFSEEQGEELPQGILRELSATLHAVASERCRNLVVSMGYPAPPIRVVPALEAVEQSDATTSRGAVSKSTSAKPRTRKRAKS